MNKIIVTKLYPFCDNIKIDKIDSNGGGFRGIFKNNNR